MSSKMPPEATVNLGRVFLCVCVVVAVCAVGLACMRPIGEWQEGCLWIFPHQITKAKPEVSRFPWEVCNSSTKECITVAYEDERVSPELYRGCFIWRGVDRLRRSWCGVEITSRSLGERTVEAEQHSVWTGWLEKNCVDMSHIDAAIDKAFTDLTNECAHLQVVTHRMADCRGNPMNGIELLSGEPLSEYSFPQ